MTIDQALKKGIEAHKAGRIQEADRLYTSILKVQPEHPDANHNMGVLAVGIGKVSEALPFFKSALEANPEITQFWVSSIDALIKLDRLDDARSVLDQAEKQGIKADELSKLGEKLGVSTVVERPSVEHICTNAIERREGGHYNAAASLILNHVDRYGPTAKLLAILSHCYLLNEQIDAGRNALERAKEIDTSIAIVAWNEARFLLKEHNIVDALRVAQHTHQKFPDDVEGLSVLGACLRANGNLEEGLIILNRAIILDSNHAEVYINRGLIQLAKGNKTEALLDLEKAHRIKPHLKQIWDLIIALYVEGNRYVQAINTLIKMIEIDPSHQKSLALLIQYNQKINDVTLAIMSFQKVLKVLPKDASMHVNLGIAMNKNGDHHGAVENFRKALSIKPDYAEALNNMGISYQEQGRFEEAIEAYRKAVSIKPDYADAYNNLGVAFKEQGKLDEAIEAFDTALAIMPDNSYAYNNLGNTLKAQGRLDEAVEAYRTALSIKPDHAEVINNIGIALREQGKLEQAIEAHRKALTIKADYVEAYNNIGISLREQGKLDEATDAYKKAISIKPDYVDAYNNMGAALTDQGNLEEAIEAYNKALVISPDHAEAKENVTSLHIQVQGTILSSKEWSKYALGCLKTDINQTPKLHVLRAISFFVAANLTKAQRCVEDFKACDPEVVANLDPRDKVFCSAYCGFLSALLTESLAEKRPDLDTGNLIYHIGESHCLSYAHRFINMNRKTFRIVPSITFGAKAHHFAKKSDDAYKAITMMTLASIPKGSEVFISFGEIDCRPNEGFISAATKLDQPLEDLIASTVEGYLQWFVQQNRTLRHRMYFLNVPAPIYNQRYSSTTNADVARVVSLFNSQVEKQVAHYELRTIDIFRFTLGQDGFSNGQFHIDQHHLGAKAIPEIERQLAL